MKKNQPLGEQWVHKFTSPAYMKFTPKQDLQLPDHNPPPSLIGKIRNYFSPPKRQPPPTIPQPTPKKTGDWLRYLRQLGP